MELPIYIITDADIDLIKLWLRDSYAGTVENELMQRIRKLEKEIENHQSYNEKASREKLVELSRAKEMLTYFEQNLNELLDEVL